MRGSVMDSDQRLSIRKYIYIRLLLFIPEIVLTIAGSIWIFHPGKDCDTDIVWSIRVLVGFQWVVIVVVVIFVLILFNPMGKLDSEGNTLFNSTTAFEQVNISVRRHTSCNPQ